MSTPKKKPQDRANGSEASSKSKLSRDRNAIRVLKSTATAAQYARVLQLLRIGKRSTIELRKHGVIAPAARIKELKDRYGYDIPTVQRVDLWDEEGFVHPRVAVYELHGEPEGAA